MTPDTPVVFLHAFPLNASMWTRQVQALEDRTTLTPHFPGFADRAPAEADLSAFAGAVLADMDRAGMERAVVVGLSMGGYVAFRLHALAPHRVAALVLADTRAEPDDGAGKTKRTDQAMRIREEGTGWMPQALVPALLGETTRRKRPDVVSTVERLMAESGAEGVARALEAMRERPDSTPELARIQVPTLVVVGEEDTLTPLSDARSMAQAIAGARLEVIPRAGHLANLEAPDPFNEVLTSFLG